MLVTSREHQRMQCSLMVQQALGRLDQPRHSSSSSSSAAPPTPDSQLDSELVAGTVQKAFNRAPRETAAAILHGLGELDRVHLLLALQTSTSRETLQKRDTEYVDDLVKIVKASPLHSGLTRGQIANAIAYQRMLQRYSSYSQKPPTAMQLGAVMLASGLPFLGFGFCDNLVMIVAGDAIDSLFGAKLGITTLASAGLGNIVADVVGVSATQQIKERSRKIKWAQPPRLSTLQQAMGSVKIAKMGGACLGVSIGCVLGMLPLVCMPPGFFNEPGSGHGHGQDHTAAVDST